MKLSFLLCAVVLGALACDSGGSTVEGARDARVADPVVPDARVLDAAMARDGSVDARVVDANTQDASSQDANSLTPDVSADAGSVSDAGPDAQGTVSERQACLAYVEAICRREGACAVLSNYQVCQRRLAGRCPDLTFAPGSTNDPAALLACAPEWKKISCNEYYAGVTPACAPKGARAAGETCINASQCASYSCSGQSGYCGVCLNRVPQGGSCSWSRECVVGNACSGVNGSCYLATPGGFEQAYLGEPCSAALGCALGHRCEADASSSTGSRCVAKALGDSCNGDDCPGAFCDTVSGRCEPLPREAQPCAQARGIWEEECAAGFYCDGRTCVKSLELGEDCNNGGRRCVPGLLCTPKSTSGSQCTRERQEGESCSDALDRCTQGTACTNGACVSTRQGLAEACK